MVVLSSPVIPSVTWTVSFITIIARSSLRFYTDLLPEVSSPCRPRSNKYPFRTSAYDSSFDDNNAGCVVSRRPHPICSQTSTTNSNHNSTRTTIVALSPKPPRHTGAPLIQKSRGSGSTNREHRSCASRTNTQLHLTQTHN